MSVADKLMHRLSFGRKPKACSGAVGACGGVALPSKAQGKRREAMQTLNILVRRPIVHLEGQVEQAKRGLIFFSWSQRLCGFIQAHAGQRLGFRGRMGSHEDRE